MSWAAIIPALLIGTIASVLVTCAIAWFVLSRWLEGRSLIIASVACAIAAGLGRSSYSGPSQSEALFALLSAVLTLVVGLLVGKFWLIRWGRRTNG